MKKCHWFKCPAPGNLGDIIMPFLMRADGVEPEYVTKDYAGKIIGCGSILGIALPGDHVWGSGIMNKHIKPEPFAVYHAVRGWRSYDRCKECGVHFAPVVGDPALLLPRFVEKSKSNGKACIVPHYADFEDVASDPAKNVGLDVINILGGDVAAKVREITAYDLVYSSSLHGLIVAHAYGIPCAWVEFGRRLVGDGVKFDDHFSAVGLDCVKFTSVNANAQKRAYEDAEMIMMPNLDLLWECRAWK